MAGEVWFNDSAPGNAQPASLLKCGGRKPSLGLSPQTFSIASPLLDTLADRALVAPGTNPPLSPDRKTRAQQLGFLGTDGSPYFDGNTVLFDFDMPTVNSGSFSLSCWLFPDNVQKGSIIRSPIMNRSNIPGGLYIGTAGVGATFSGGVNTGLGSDWPTHPAQIWMDGMRASGPGIAAHYWTETTDIGAPFANDFLHLMIGIHAVSNNASVTIYVNDTPIISDQPMTTEGTNGTAAFTIPFADLTGGNAPGTTGSSPIIKVSQANRWSLGAGAYIDDGASVSQTNDNVGAALQCAVTEWWLAPGHYVDWTNSVNRNKFHTQDATLSHYIPTNIGSRGQVMGFLPTIYCTGSPGAFRINRATGKLLSMQGGGRDVTFIPHYGEVQNLFSDDRVPGGT